MLTRCHQFPALRCALGPYLNVFLVNQQHWSQSEVGLVTTLSGLLGLSVQTPIGTVIAILTIADIIVPLTP
jgi:hypothetical protein